MLNLTPHEIVIQRGDIRIALAPSGRIARVSTIERYAEDPCQITLSNDSGTFTCEVPVVTRRFGYVTGLPESDDPCIVSSIVLEAVKIQQPWRRNVFAPDTGPMAIRDDSGRVVAVTRLVGIAP